MSFEVAIRVFADPFAFTEHDRSEGHEYRWRTIGAVGGMAVIVVAHTDREDDGIEVIRLISARRADSKERRRYEQDREA